MGGSGLDICVLDQSLGYVSNSGFILGIGTLILECVSLPVRCPAPLSVCLSGFSMISDGLTDHLNGFYNRIVFILPCKQNRIWYY